MEVFVYSFHSSFTNQNKEVINKNHRVIDKSLENTSNWQALSGPKMANFLEEFKLSHLSVKTATLSILIDEQ